MAESTTEEAPATFLHRLFSVLGDEEAQQSIRWLPDGRAFDIHNPNKFTNDVLKTHFNSISLETFVTLLKRFGFTRKKSKTAVEYYGQYVYQSHLFRRDLPNLCDLLAQAQLAIQPPLFPPRQNLHGQANVHNPPPFAQSPPNSPPPSPPLQANHHSEVRPGSPNPQLEEKTPKSESEEADAVHRSKTGPEPSEEDVADGLDMQDESEAPLHYGKPSEPHPRDLETQGKATSKLKTQDFNKQDQLYPSESCLKRAAKMAMAQEKRKKKKLEHRQKAQIAVALCALAQCPITYKGKKYG